MYWHLGLIDWMIVPSLARALTHADAEELAQAMVASSFGLAERTAGHVVNGGRCSPHSVAQLVDFLVQKFYIVARLVASASLADASAASYRWQLTQCEYDRGWGRATRRCPAVWSRPVRWRAGRGVAIGVPQGVA